MKKNEILMDEKAMAQKNQLIMEKKPFKIQGKFFGVIVLVFFIYMLFGIFNLSKFETADEHYWTNDPNSGRIFHYWQSLREGNWKGTHINDKPGVTLSYVSGVALLFEKNPPEPTFSDFKFYRVYDPARTERVNFLFRLPLLIFNGIFCFLLFYLISRLMENAWIGLWSVIFMMLSPILLGMSRIVNPDSLLWVFTTATLLCFLLMLKTSEWKFTALSAVFFGLALLTKYVACLLIPFLFLALVLFALVNVPDWGEDTKKKVSRLLGSYAIILGGAFLLFGLMMPAAFLKFEYFYFGTVGFDGMFPLFLAVVFLASLILVDAWIWQSRGLRRLAAYLPAVIRISMKLTSGAMAFFIIFILVCLSLKIGLPSFVKDIPFDADRGVVFTQLNLLAKIFLEIIPLTYSLTPLSLAAFLFILLKYSVRPGQSRFFAGIFSLFLAIFYAAMLTQGLLVNVRYQIMIYPIVFILVAVGLWELFSLKHFNRIGKIWITLALIIISIPSLWFIKPYYLNYANVLLPKDRLISDAWGLGLYEAAQYLNNLPDASSLVVWVDYNGFCPYFKGICIKGSDDWKKAKKSGVKVQYLINTRRGSIMYKDIWKEFKTYLVFDDSSPIWSLIIDDRPENFIKIYSARVSNKWY